MAVPTSLLLDTRTLRDLAVTSAHYPACRSILPSPHKRLLCILFSSRPLVKATPSSARLLGSPVFLVARLFFLLEAVLPPNLEVERFFEPPQERHISKTRKASLQREVVFFPKRLPTSPPQVAEQALSFLLKTCRIINPYSYYSRP